MLYGKQVFVKLAQGVLFLLVFIHWVLPFTPANQHSELTILVGSLILGGAFLFLGVRSIKSSFVYLLSGLILLLIVYAVSAATGASPLSEGSVVKVLFTALLLLGVFSAKKLRASATSE